MRVGGVGGGTSSQATRQVDARRTPTSMNEIRAALARAIESSTGRPPRQGAVDVLAAQVSLETAHGSAMYNYNFGGIKGASPSGTTAHYLTHEVENGQQITIDQGFRAYGSLDEGARDYVNVLQARFPGAFSRAVSGDVDGFAHALKQSRYYTASEHDYDAGLRAAAGLPAGSAQTSNDGPIVVQADPSASAFSTSDQLSRVLDAVAASASRIAEPDAKT
jgi:hypothetical protein